ncbi:acyl-CoA dehydrogenase [Sphaerisporangium album]|uniref:Acyl-CoA dehydrogenase n=1 Tax=Sphaerisporangium album TaxID=509200 RepID=A0A367FIU0_9ACTN|nr:acyl-CoA dehydrogenase family protein [Sphaerisporangium album]RCG30286.1 acyl-CoA dehydrogenase [Sphaerisporangium album]
MTVKEQVAVAEELERYLGDPHDPASPMSFAKIIDLDEREEFPYELVGLLQRWQVHQYCLPAAFGGRAGDVEVGFNLLRLVARRDPTTATALMLTNLAFMPTWIAGTDEQKRHFVGAINRGARMAWGLSERDHGSDVLSNEMRAEKVHGGYLLTGEKWLIGNATVADVVSVQARTSERGGPGGWSIFAVDKRRCPAGSVVHLPNERIHGLRALDMSGIRLDGVFVPDSARLGAEGQGLELALKSGQVARTTINGMGLGAVDTAMRVTLDFVTERVIFGQKVIDVPYTRRQLAESFADMIVADAVTTGAVRGLQANPGQASIYSSVVKYYVPTSLERTLSQLSVVLGARLYLRSHPHYGIYQKMLRDALVAIFADGNTVVNLKNVALQLDGLLEKVGGPVTPEADARVQAQYDLDATLPEWNPADQQLFSRGADDTVLLLPDAVRRLREQAGVHPDERQRHWLSRAADVAESLHQELDRVRAEVGRLREAHGKGYAGTAELFRLAEQYCAVHAAAATAHLFTRSARALAEPFPDGALLLMCLERLARQFHPVRPVTDQEVVDRVVEILRGLHSGRQLFSFWQFQLSASGERR